MKAGTQEHKAFMRPHFPEAFELFYAVIEGTLEEVIERLVAGDNHNAVDTSGRTPIFYATQLAKRLIIADALLGAGAVIDLWDDCGWHPLHFAYRDMLCLKWLLDHNVDPNVAIRPAKARQFDPIGWTTLHRVVRFNLLSHVELLLAYGADANSQAEDGSTPLHVASQHWKLYKRLIRTLIDGGADVNAVTNEGRTPLHEVAARRGQYAQAVARLLVFRGARVDIPDATGRLAVDFLNESPLSDSLRHILRQKDL